ncbi:bifunctional tetrahydrofolate synthase/dihydrofolate synthase [Luteimonas sp. RD2P54]|uniref:Dihydrofolate synthase/folylpolyglutamate synthase n=1 Tax=Luteimonas endophytica TaxID=3042023 RepID=A0ABT6J4P1_9GAMM|nr:bifunctional tetrahydrofolate synthase/dihydrofolate synthase [Luteimonas endophytica]MDH5821786.1 bifunctional tetrahydrofolate synthase/dihydrofolate synthase [Luteimonas endophytica]
MPRTLADWLGHIERQHPREIEMGLERARAVAGRLRLAPPARRVISVAGTNGKGSTVAFIEAIARAAGWHVGTYTSPHLFEYNERVRVDGRPATDDALAAAFAAVEAARTVEPPVPLTYFEFGTLAALWLFARQRLDLAILEVGLGGRLDAVNLVDADVAVITTVDLDHQDWLGADREAIGREKAGIARPWKPLVLGEDDPPSSVLGHAYAIGAPAIRAGSDFMFERLAGGGWRWREVGYAIDLPEPQLAGAEQRRNAAAAIAALRALRRSVPRAAIVQGVASAALPARLQRLHVDGVEVVIDVGHNPQAARTLADWLRAAPVPGRTRAVYAALADKDAPGVVAALQDAVDAWYLAGLPDAGPRGQESAAFAVRLAGSAAAGGSVHATVAAALAAALAEASPGDRVLVAGSFHTAAAALAALHGRH